MLLIYDLREVSETKEWDSKLLTPPYSTDYPISVGAFKIMRL